MIVWALRSNADIQIAFVQIKLCDCDEAVRKRVRL